MSSRSHHASIDHVSNTMEEDYHNSRYDDSQPGSRVVEKQQFRIIIRNVSEHLTIDGIRNLCSNFGTVLDVHKPKTTSAIAFVNFSSSVEAEKAIRGINEGINDQSGSRPGRMNADFAKEKKKELNPFYTKKDPKEFNENAFEYDADRKVDMNSRKIKGPFGRPYKADVKEREHFVTEDDYKMSALSAVDPEREFLVQSDAYDKERYLSNHNSNNTPDVNHLNRTNAGGRSYFVENQDVIEKAKNMSLKSNGDHNKTNDSFGYNSSFLEESFYGGTCIKCSRKAIGTCEICGAFYCSANCQHSDWPNHKNTCGIPRLILNKSSPGKISFSGKGNLSNKSVSPNKSQRVSQEHHENLEPVQMNGRQENYKKSDPIVETGIFIKPIQIDGSCPVIITAVIDERTVFVRPISHDTEYLKATEDITEYSGKADNLTVLPQKGDVILSKFQGIFYRALVLNNVNKFNVTVAYIDYGNIEIKNLVDLKKLKPELQQIPKFIKKLILKDISGDVKSEKVLDYLAKNMNNLSKLQIIFDKNDLKEVELINELTKESLNKIIIDMLTIRPPAIYGNFSTLAEMGVNVIPVGKNITVVITDNSQVNLGLISCMNEVDLVSLCTLDKQVQDYCNANKSSGYSPRNMELCLAQFEDERWYRAYCVEGGIGDGFISLIFCDYGNMSMVKIEKIKKFPRDMLSTPAYAATCYIKGFPKKSETISEKAKAKLSAFLDCDIKRVPEISKDERGEYYFYFPEIKEILEEN